MDYGMLRLGLTSRFALPAHHMNPLVMQTGLFQPVFIWREKPVLLALLSNLTIPVPASYPVFCTKWREIRGEIFCGTNFYSICFLALAHEIFTDHEHADFLQAEAESHRCCPSTNIQNLRGGAQLFRILYFWRDSTNEKNWSRLLS